MSFLGLAVWVVNQGFLSERNRKWGTKGAPEGSLGELLSRHDEREEATAYL